MRNASYLLMTGLALCLAPHVTADLVAVNNSGGTRMRLLEEADLNQVNLDLPLTDIRAVVVGDVITTSPGLEVVVAHGSPSVLEVRTADGSTVIVSRDFAADGENIPPGGGPTGFGPETIHDLALGECRADLAGLEIGVASQAEISGNFQGFVRVLSPQTGSLADRNGTGAGLNVTSVEIGDVNSRFTGGELVFCWNYEPNGDTFNTQVAVFTPASPAGFVGNTIRNIPGVVRPAALAIGEAVGNGGTPEILAGTDLGEIHLFQPSILDPGNSSLLSYAVSTPSNSLRAGFIDVKAVALGDILPNVQGAEIVTFSTDGETSGALRIIDSNSDGLTTDLQINDQLASDVTGLRAYDGLGSIANGEVYAAADATNGSLVILDSNLAEATRRSNLGTWVQLDALVPPPPAPPSAVRSVDWSLFYE